MIAICPNPYRDANLTLTRHCCEILQKAGFATVICPVFAEPDDDILPADLPDVALLSLQRTLLKAG